MRGLIERIIGHRKSIQKTRSLKRAIESEKSTKANIGCLVVGIDFFVTLLICAPIIGLIDLGREQIIALSPEWAKSFRILLLIPFGIPIFVGLYPFFSRVLKGKEKTILERTVEELKSDLSSCEIQRDAEFAKIAIALEDTGRQIGLNRQIVNI